ncbi:hypothetical protein G7Y89_g4237 [Cudoniella acicularis]|uniref:Uncharacterized protein n=1 Tax=Cudoniella acicularis TaxID=354080 RepID=A0A8H4W570_9HELO|nr:hypothetical protein G7Y89_g4237 [Cudoniella acicularis]
MHDERRGLLTLNSTGKLDNSGVRDKRKPRRRHRIFGRTHMDKQSKGRNKPISPRGAAYNLASSKHLDGNTLHPGDRLALFLLFNFSAGDSSNGRAGNAFEIRISDLTLLPHEHQPAGVDSAPHGGRRPTRQRSQFDMGAFSRGRVMYSALPSYASGPSSARLSGSSNLRSVQYQPVSYTGTLGAELRRANKEEGESRVKDIRPHSSVAQVGFGFENDLEETVANALKAIEETVDA